MYKQRLYTNKPRKEWTNICFKNQFRTTSQSCIHEREKSVIQTNEQTNKKHLHDLGKCLTFCLFYSIVANAKFVGLDVNFGWTLDKQHV